MLHQTAYYWLRIMTEIAREEEICSGAETLAWEHRQDAPKLSAPFLQPAEIPPVYGTLLASVIPQISPFILFHVVLFLVYPWYIVLWLSIPYVA